MARGRLDADEPVLRAAYGILPADSVRLERRASPDRILAAAGRSVGRPFDVDGLRVEADVEIDGVRHVRWRQTTRGVPVLDRTVAATMNRDGAISFVVNGVDGTAVAVDTRPAVGPSRAREAARTILPSSLGRVGNAVLSILPGSEPRLVWQVFVWPDGEPAEWRVLVDAMRGDVVGVRDETVTKQGRGPDERLTAGAAGHGLHGPPDPVAFISVAGFARSTDGQGYVFDPDPLATSGAAYGPPYVDAGDADSPELRAERRLAALPAITQGNDGLYRLDGPYVRIVGENSSGREVYAPPAESLPTGFSYDRAQDGFEAVSAYHHLDASQRYVQSLGFNDLQSSPLPVNPAGTTSDDSGWIAALRYIFFGTGGVDDAEDAFVLWHEYAHALFEAGAPGLRSNLEGQALHEGWSDYWAASYQRSLIEAGATRRTDWERAFRWDAGDGQIWLGRMLDFSGRYPEDTCSDNTSPGACSIHNDGRLWATVMLEIYGELGRTVTDRLNLLSHRYLSPPVTFRDAAAAVVQADVDHYGGAHLSVLVQRLGARGLLDASAYGPHATHEVLEATETLNGTRPVTVSTIPGSSPIASVAVFHRFENGPESRLDLVESEPGVYRGDLPLPASSGFVKYWIRIVDDLGRAAVLPAGAPAEIYSFRAGPDTVAPTVTHAPLGHVTLAEWPPLVRATISDALGVKEASVEYLIRYPDGSVAASGVFVLAALDGVFQGTFDVPVSSVRAGSRVEYRIRAVDNALSANTAFDPATGFHEFHILGAGVIRYYDADHPGIGTEIGGQWSAGPSHSGVQATPGGGSVWGVGLDAPYQEASGRSRLSFPPMDLSGIESAWLVFRHWYDTAHDGRAEPGLDAGDALWDGGNVKVSVDGGTTWQVAQPDGGYSGRIRSGGGNPMAGESAFGGYGLIWRLERVPLPIGPDVRVALDFGVTDSDEGVSEGRYGWRVDEMVVTTFLPVDERPPEVLWTPEARTVVPLGNAARIEWSIAAVDDVGLVDVVTEYAVTASGTRYEGRTRAAVSATDVTMFEVAIEPPIPLISGDRVEYRWFLTDGAGRERVVPPLGDAPFTIEVRLVDSHDILVGAQPSGGFGGSPGSWILAGGEGALVTVPFHVSVNGESAELTLTHSYRTSNTTGTRLVVSADDGLTWSALEPDRGYPGVVGAIPAWTGSAPGIRIDTFQLADWMGRTILFRFESVGDPLESDDSWVLEEAVVVQTTPATGLEQPEQPMLHANFPDPAADRTSITFFVPNSQRVSVEVFDLLGRRVAVLADGIFPDGGHGLTWDVSQVSPGVYFARLVTGSSTLSESIVVAR